MRARTRDASCHARPRNTSSKALAKLLKRQESLEEEISNLHHELRRVRDGLERAGGASRALEQKASQLLKNIDLCERELTENRRRKKDLERQLSSFGNDDHNNN
jgi:predicted  nucleic acid-binding Zn-ribbon protein